MADCTEESIHNDLLEYAREIETKYGIRIEAVEFSWKVHHSIERGATHATALDVTVKSSYSGRKLS